MFSYGEVAVSSLASALLPVKDVVASRPIPLRYWICLWWAPFISARTCFAARLGKISERPRPQRLADWSLAKLHSI